MSIMQLDKSKWQGYFDGISKALVGKQAEVEIDSLRVGSQIEAEWLPLIGIVYDPKSDIVEVAMDGLDHMIQKPRSVVVDQDASGLQSIEVIDEDNAKQIVKLRDPVMLPPPLH